MTNHRSTLSAALLVALPGLGADPAPPIANERPISPPQAGSAGWSSSAQEQALIQKAVDAVYPALVRIDVVFEEGDGGRMQKMRASGSGAIISEEGYVLTNHHVAGRATRVVCRLSNREEIDATVVGSDPLSDLCVLKLDLSGRRTRDRLPVARFGSSDLLKVGDVVLAMGSPAGLSQSVTKGIVSNTAMILPSRRGSMTQDGERVGELVRWVGHDAVIYPGNSGGPLVNLQGEIVGVNEIAVGSLGGAIPSSLAQTVAKHLMERGLVPWSWAGLEAQPLLKDSTNTSGILVSSVLPASPAAASGLRPGDIITAWNGQPLQACRAEEDVPVFNRMVLTTPVGTEVAARGLRSGEPQTWRLTTQAREPNQARESEMKSWGLTLRSLTRVSALENLRQDQRGVVVDTVRPGGPCAEAKPPLRPLDVITHVNNRVIENAQDLAQYTREFLKGITEPKPVLLAFERDAQQLLTVAKIGPEPKDDKPTRPDKAWLGAQTQVLTSDLAEALGLEGKKGVRVTQIVPESPAAAAGVKAGDIFLKLDGQVIAARTLADADLFENLIREYKVGAEAEIDGVRDGQPLHLAAKLGKQPKPGSDLEEFKDDQFEFKARELSLAERVAEKLPKDLAGVRVVSVQPAGWAALGGLNTSDVILAVNDQLAPSIPALRQIMEQLTEKHPRRVIFQVRRGIRTQFLELEPKW